MEKHLHEYQGQAIEITYDLKRCIHAAECVRGLPPVFDSQRRPWVQPDQAEANAVAAVVERCPSGALHYTRRDGGPAEQAAPVARIVPQPNGPLHLRGAITVCAADGTPLVHDTRVALCRCGHSANKPFCDGTHSKVGFQDAGALAEKTLRAPEADAPAAIVATPTENGPLQVAGAFEICDAAWQACQAGARAYLCRCGGSGSKPFCDGTHSKIGFSG